MESNFNWLGIFYPIA